jgi:uncharacterized protein (UPF0262 family)
MPEQSGHLTRVVLEGAALHRLSPLQEADRAQAVADLESENEFAAIAHPDVQCILHLSIQEGRLVFDIRDANDQPLTAVVLALGPFKMLVKDYQMLLDSYADAIAEGREAKVQAIDMGRRGLHNEGATLMQERLAGKITIDFPTARRLFTLVCALNQHL